MEKAQHPSRNLPVSPQPAFDTYPKVGHEILCWVAGDKRATGGEWEVGGGGWGWSRAQRALGAARGWAGFGEKGGVSCWPGSCSCLRGKT